MFTSAAMVEALPDASSLPRLVDSTGREFPLNPGVNSVGREGTDVLIQDGTVSRRHAQLTLEGSQLTVEDLGSTNGTSVAGRKLASGESAVAYSGDTVKFGNIILTLTVPGGDARPAALPAGDMAPEPPAEDRGEPVGALRLGDGTEYPLYSGVNVLGRRSTNQIQLADAFASGKHAEVVCQLDGTVQVVDAGSTNGTYINGERLAPQTPVTLLDGMAVTFAKTPMTFRAAGGGAAGESAPATETAEPPTLLGGDVPAAADEPKSDTDPSGAA
jgi:pSer/pThr/pTyr-binding forkhead associated (FHA) protein